MRMRRWLWLVAVLVAVEAGAQPTPTTKCDPFDVGNGDDRRCGRLCYDGKRQKLLGCPPLEGLVTPWIEAGRPAVWPPPTSTPGPTATRTPAPTLAPTVAPTAAPSSAPTPADRCLEPDGELPDLRNPDFPGWRGVVRQLPAGRPYRWCVTVQEDAFQLQFAVGDKTGGAQCFWGELVVEAPPGVVLPRPPKREIGRDPSTTITRPVPRGRWVLQVTPADNPAGCSNRVQVVAAGLTLPPPTGGPVATPRPTASVATPRAVETPRPTPPPARCPSWCPDGTFCSQTACETFGACACGPTPAPARTPTPTPPSAVVGALDFGYGDPAVFAGQEITAQPVVVKQGTGWRWIDPDPRAGMQGFYAVDHGTYETSDEVLLEGLRRWRARGVRPTVFIGEASTGGWCDSQARRGGFGGDPRTWAETLTTGGGVSAAALRARVDLLLANDVRPSELIRIDYTFFWRHDLRQQGKSMAALEAALPQFFPRGRAWAGGAPNFNGGFPTSRHDLPEPLVVAGDAHCVGLYLRAWDAQHPELRTVRHRWQLSNCGGAYGWSPGPGQPRMGWDIVRLVGEKVRATGRQLEYQVEACREQERLAETPPPVGKPEAPWYVGRRDCEALRAVLAQRPTTVSVFDSWLYRSTDPLAWEACAR